MPDEESDSARELRQTVQELHLVVVKLTSTVEGLGATVAALTATTITRDAFEAMRETVNRNDDDSRERDEALQKGLDRHGGYWDWLIKLVAGAVVIALLGLVIHQSGGLQL